MAVPFATADEVQERLSELARARPEGAVVFDADGTLWSHDVGWMVFELAVERQAFKPASQPALRQEAERIGLEVDPTATASSIAESLLGACRGGMYDHREVAEMQVWAYVGYTEREFRELCHDAFSTKGHEAGWHQEVLDLARWARRTGLQVGIVSASPRWVVEEATTELGFIPTEIEAGDPNLERGRIAVGMRHPLPYGPDKVIAGRRLLQSRPWLAVFGDSGFDVDMMNEAQLAIGIGDRSAMLRGLQKHPQALRLSLSEESD